MKSANESKTEQTQPEWLYENLAAQLRLLREGKRGWSQIEPIKQTIQCANNLEICEVVKYCLRDGLLSVKPAILQQAWQKLYQKILKIDNEVQGFPSVWDIDFLTKLSGECWFPFYLDVKELSLVEKSKLDLATFGCIQPSIAYGMAPGYLQDAPQGWVFSSGTILTRQTEQGIDTEMLRKYGGGCRFGTLKDFYVYLAWRKACGRLPYENEYMALPGSIDQENDGRCLVVAYNQGGFYPVKIQKASEYHTIHMLVFRVFTTYD